jgi:hypothetical protein
MSSPEAWGGIRWRGGEICGGQRGGVSREFGAAWRGVLEPAEAVQSCSGAWS